MNGDSQPENLLDAISGQHTSRTALLSILPRPALVYQEGRNWKNIPFPLGCQLLQRSPRSRERRACVEQCFQDLAIESLPAWAPCAVTGARRRDYPPEGRSERFRDSPSGGSSLLSSPPAYRLRGCPSSAFWRDEQCQGCSTALADQMQLYSIPATS